jgi:hypothetical protein
MVLFITIAVKTSNPTFAKLIRKTAHLGFLIRKFLWFSNDKSLSLFNFQRISLTAERKINTAAGYLETHSMYVTSMVHFVRAVAAFFCLFMQTTSLSLAPW